MTCDEAKASFAASWPVNSTMRSMARSPRIGFRRRTNTAAAICAHDDRAVTVNGNRLKGPRVSHATGPFLVAKLGFFWLGEFKLGVKSGLHDLRI